MMVSEFTAHTLLLQDHFRLQFPLSWADAGMLFCLFIPFKLLSFPIFNYTYHISNRKRTECCEIITLDDFLRVKRRKEDSIYFIYGSCSLDLFLCI